MQEKTKESVKTNTLKEESASAGETVLHVVFHKLTPTADCNRMEIYNKAFETVFSDSDIQNVAISGPYGCGKSSILETYKKTNKGKIKFLHISLTHFLCKTSNAQNSVNGTTNKQNAEAKSSETDGDKHNRAMDENNPIRSMEEQIINQLVQQIPEKRIPQSIFCAKRAVKEIDYFLVSLAVTFLVCALMYFMRYELVKTWILGITNVRVNGLLSFCLTETFQTGILAACVVLIVYTLYKCLYILASQNILKSLNIQGNEIELKGDSENSYFDKYLDEILYLLDRTRADVIVFEDIDRFKEAIPIFERLRDICRIANSGSNSIRKKKLGKKKRTLRFFYLLRDDVFETKDRTKFFDLIVPVIPVVSGFNSFEVMRSYLCEEVEGESCIKEDFLKAISLYIDDMRLIKNITNEYFVYYGTLQKIGLDANKMLAMVIYKNLFPKDFAALQDGKGYVHEIFAGKSRLIKELGSDGRKVINELNNEIKEIEAVTEKSIQELEFIRDGYKSILSEEENDNWVSGEYVKRKTLIMSNSTRQNKISQLMQKKGSEELRLSRLEGMQLSEIFSLLEKSAVDKEAAWDDYVNEPLKQLENQKYAGLLKYFIMEGYIDENYNDYCNYFYEGILTWNDKAFVQSMLERKEVSYGNEIQSPEVVLDTLGTENVKRLGALNNNIFLNLMKNRNSKYLEPMFFYIMSNEKITFLTGFYEKYPCWNFIVEVNEQWPQFLMNWIHSPAPLESRGQIVEYCILSLIISNRETLRHMNRLDSLSNYINAYDGFLNKDHYKFEDFRKTEHNHFESDQLDRYFTSDGISDAGVKKLIDGLVFLQVRFSKIDEEKADEKLLHDVYTNNLYELNENMIRLFLHTEYSISEAALQGKTKPELVQLVNSKEKEPMCRYYKSMNIKDEPNDACE